MMQNNKEYDLEKILSFPKAQKTKKIFDDNLNKVKRSIANGIPIRLMCEELGISETTFYNWKKFYEPLQNAISEGERQFYRKCGRSLDRLISHRKSKTKEHYIGDKGEYEKVVTRDKEPDLAAIKYSMGIRERMRKEELRKGQQIISEDDLKKLTDEELIKLLKDVKSETEQLERRMREVLGDE